MLNVGLMVGPRSTHNWMSYVPGLSQGPTGKLHNTMNSTRKKYFRGHF